MSRRRLPRLATALLVLSLAGCGGGEAAGPGAGGLAAEDAPDGPVSGARTSTREEIARAEREQLSPRVRMSAKVRRQLDAGRIGIVGLDLVARVQPSSLRANREQTISDARWSGWDTPRATASATVRTLICEPSCGRGQAVETPGRLVASAPRVCGARRYYAKLTLVARDPVEGRERAAATYLRTPC